MSALGHKFPLTRPWLYGHEDRPDFVVVEPRWAFKLVRDGEELDECCARFEDGGRYRKLIDEGKIVDWIILDCRTSRPERVGKYDH